MKNVCLILAVLLMVHMSCDACAVATNRMGGEVDNTTTAVHDGRYTDHLADIIEINKNVVQIEYNAPKNKQENKALDAFINLLTKTF